MDGRKAPGWLLWGVLLLIVLAQTQAALCKNLKDGPFISAGEVFAALLFGLWALWALVSGEWRHVKWPPFAVWVLVAVAFVAIGQADSRDAVKSGIVDVAQYVLYFLCVYLLFANALTDETRVRRAVGVLAGLTALMVLVGLAQYAKWADPARAEDTFRRVSSTFGLGELLVKAPAPQPAVEKTGPEAETPVAPPKPKPPLPGGFYIGGKSSRSIYCDYLLMVLPVLFALGLGSSGPKWLKPTLLVLVAIGAVTMLSGWHFWALAAVLIALALRYSVKAALATAAVVAVFVAVSPVVFVRNHQANLVEVTDFYEEGVLDQSTVTSETYQGGAVPTTTEVKKRWIEWQPALNLVRTSPVLGVGTGGYQLHIGPEYGMLPNFEKIEPGTNCGWLVIAGSMGLCGLMALVGVFYTGYRGAVLQSTKASSEYLRALSLGLAGSMLGLFLAMIFSNVLERGLSITVILMLALVSVVQGIAEQQGVTGEAARAT